MSAHPGRDTAAPPNHHHHHHHHHQQRRRPRRRGSDADDEPTKTVRRYPRLEGFRSDLSWWNVAALEDFDDDMMAARPAALLQRAIIDIATEQWPTTAATIEQAVANSLSRWHRIDVDYIATQHKLSPGAVRAELEAVAFETPDGHWELAAHYLAGDVVGRLDAAIAAAETDPRFGRNVGPRASEVCSGCRP